jgi:xanthine dehydrogenase accessory factor
VQLDIFERIAALTSTGSDFVLVTVVEVSGSVPAKVGSRMVVTADGVEGTVGGGAQENELTRQARALLMNRGQAGLVKLDISELDMHCGGEMTSFLEPFFARAELWVFGGGHVAGHLVPLAASIGFRVVVVDMRPEFANKERFPQALKTLNIPYPEAVKKIPAGSYVVILTHKHAHDQDILMAVAQIKPSLPYIGMIGSRKKVTHTFSKLKEAGIDIGENIYSPIGLDVGGGSPAEIAVSITAELLGVLHKKKHLPHCR